MHVQMVFQDPFRSFNPGNFCAAPSFSKPSARTPGGKPATAR